MPQHIRHSFRSNPIVPTVLLFCLPLFFLISPALAFSNDSPFNNASNWGGTGLLEIPTARVLGDGIVRLGYAEARPYRWYTGAMGVLPGMEVSGRFTEITNIDSGLGPSYGANKDKALDLKYQLLPETRWFPALAIGLHDFHGTRLFEAQYLAVSRQFFSLDVTLGIGNKRLSGQAKLPFTDDYAIWGGVEWALNRHFHLLAEYNPIDYKTDISGARGVPEGADLPLNFGLRWKMLPGIDLGLSYQRGDQIGFMTHVQLELGKPLIPKRPDPPWWTPMDSTPFAARDIHALLEAIRKAIEDAGFKDVAASTDQQNLTAEFENTKYISNRQAAGRVLRILHFHAPSDTRSLEVILKRRQIPLLKVSATPDQLEAYLMGKVSEEDFNEMLSAELIDGTETASRPNLVRVEGTEKLRYQLGLKPMLDTFFNDPSGVFRARVGIEPYAIAHPWKGGSAIAHADLPFYSNIESSNVPADRAVRSDSWRYLDDDPSFERLMFDQTLRFTKRIFGRVSVGYLEDMYAGVGGEILAFLGAGGLAVGIEGDWVQKREPGSSLAFEDLKSHTILGNVFYKIPFIQTTVQAQYGRFLAGDIGWRFQVEREFPSGLIAGFWYSVTDTDKVSGNFNKNYHDKGVFIHLPARMFTDYETNTRYRYSVTPWTRDVAAAISHWRSLFDLGSDLMPGGFKNGYGEIKK